jgi:hypothetical protein
VPLAQARPAMYWNPREKKRNCCGKFFPRLCSSLCAATGEGACVSATCGPFDERQWRIDAGLRCWCCSLPLWYWDWCGKRSQGDANLLDRRAVAPLRRAPGVYLVNFCAAWRRCSTFQLVDSLMKQPRRHYDLGTGVLSVIRCFREARRAGR